ncbi:hypothetical protein [Lysobacter gummosus]|uniref:hypothetical protein n=1 Tax=Lysobacter gummosus TaxID=262324 RepID=UPI00363C0905
MRGLHFRCIESSVPDAAHHYTQAVLMRPAGRLLPEIPPCPSYSPSLARIPAALCASSKSSIGTCTGATCTPTWRARPDARASPRR